MNPVAPDEEDAEQPGSARRTVEFYGTAPDVHAGVAARLAAEGLSPVIDAGCGDGALVDAGPPPGWMGLDVSRAVLGSVAGPVVQADATALALRDSSVGAVCALWLLYQLEEPAVAVAEAHRVLRPGGLFVACTSARDDSPELARHIGMAPPSRFDAEEAVDLVAATFGGDVEADYWDGPFVHLPHREAVEDYLLGRGISAEGAAEAAAAVTVPLDVTKRGVLVWARRLS